MPRRTVRLRLTVLYGGLFVLAGALLLTITYLLVASHAETAGVSATRDGGRIEVVSGRSGPLTVFGASSGSVASSVPVATGPDPGVAVADGIKVLQTALAVQRRNTLDQLLLWSGAALAITALLALGLGWLVAGRVLAPLRTMTAAANRISEDNLDERLALAGPEDELKELGDTIDRLLARLERAFDSQRRFVANASHELRTPLTLERTMIEVALADPDVSVDSLRAVCRRVVASGEEQERLIAALLTLARSQRGLERREPVDLEAVVSGVLEDDPRLHVVEVTAQLASAPLLGDPRLVRRLAANLLDNAARYNVADGWIDVITGTDGGAALLRVANSGPPVPAGELAALLEPFRRAAPERAGHGAGHGLGLSIAAAIASAHHADLRLRARPSGGLDVEVRFPLAAVPAPRALAAARPLS